MITALAFYLFAALTVVAALMTVTARNPVHSVLWLICAFFNAAGLMVLVGAEFIAMLLVIVYVGAVAVLFLFEAAGILLLVALVGAIVLTHRKRPGVRSQSVPRQNAVRPGDATVNVKPEVGQGVKL